MRNAYRSNQENPVKKHSRQAADPEWKQLLKLGELIVASHSPEKQCEIIRTLIGELLSAQAQVWLASPAYPLPGTSPMQTLPDADATPLAQEAFATGKMQLSPFSPAGGPCSAAAPMVANDSLLGIIQVERPQDEPFNERDLSHLEGLANHAAISMETTRQAALKQRRNEQLNLVRSVSAQIASLTNLNELYSRVTQLIRETFSFYYVAIFIVDEQKSVVRFRSSASKDATMPLRSDFWLHLGEGMIGSAAETGEEIIASDVRNETHYVYLDLLPATRAEAALPLKIENRILGVLDVQSDALNAFHETDMLVLRVLADNIALAIESTRLYDNQEQRAEQISSVFEVSHALASILDLDELLNEIVRLIQNRFGYPFVHLYTVHPGRRLVMYRAGTGERSEAMKQQGRNYTLDAPQGLIPWVARNGKTFMANDVAQEPLYLPADLPPYDTRAELSIPLIAADEVLGVLDIQSRETDAFDENDQSLFEALAVPIAIALRNATLYHSEQWRRRVAESFRDVAHLISSNLPLIELLDLILEKLEEVLPCEASAIWLLSDDDRHGAQAGAQRLRLAATRNLQVDKVFEVLQEKTVLGMLDRALASSQPVIRRPDDPSGPLGAALNFSPNYSSIAAPMRTGQKPLGMLTLAHHQEGRYGSEAQAITATFASYAAVAIQNARLYSEAQEQALISTMLLQVSEASQSTMTVDDLLATMLRLTRLLMGVKKCAFLLWEDGLQSFILKAWYGFEPAAEGTAQPRQLFSAQLPALRRLGAERAMHYLNDPGADVDLPEMRLEHGKIVMLPLLVRGELIGAFLVGLQMASETALEPGFDPKSLAILQGIAHQTSMAADNLRLLEARQEEAYVTAALLQVAQAVVTSNDLNDTLDTIVHLLPILVGIETCVIYLWDAASQLFRPTQVSGRSRKEEELIRSLPYPPGANRILDAVRASGATFLCPIAEADFSFEEWASLECRPYQAGVESIDSNFTDWLLGYPLVLQGQVMGVMVVREMNASPAFWERRLEIINGIAQQASLAIQNDIMRQEMVQAERMEREILLARQIQETFLPDTLPQLDRWELDLRWETAREIGGDFYDIFKLGDNRVGLVIADVADKGLPAALYMTVTRTLIRASSANSPSPAEVLQEVNRLLLNDSSESMFVTVVYAVLDLTSGELVYANAGHNLPLIYRVKTGAVEQLPKGGTALGILDQLNLTDHILSIEPGDALVLYTDGVTDIQSPSGAFFGDQRLINLLQESGKDTIQNILEQLDDVMIEFRRGVPPSDDITLLALRRLPLQKKRRQRTRGEQKQLP